MWRRTSACLALALAGAACEAPPRLGPPPPPELAYRVEVQHLSASVPGQERAADWRRVVPAAASCLRLRCAFYEVARLGEAGTTPIVGSAKYVQTTLPGGVFQAGSRLASGARIAHGAAALELEAELERGEQGRSTLLAESVAALPAATIVRFRCLRSADPSRALIIGVQRPGDAATAGLAVAVQGWPDEAGAAEAGAPAREVLLLEVALTPEQPVGLVLPPGPLFRSPLACILVATAAPEGGREARAHQAAVEACWREVTSAARGAIDEPAAQGLAQSLRALSGTDNRRAVVWLAGLVGARLATRAALLGDERLVSALAAAPSAILASGESLDRQHIAWRLDREALLRLARAARDGELDLALRGVLREWAGEAAAEPEALLEIVVGCDSMSRYEEQIVDENIAHLGDPDPSVRVRAFDWLVERGKAPAGFDPLGPPAERRRALARIQAPLESVPEQPPEEPAEKQPEKPSGKNEAGR